MQTFRELLEWLKQNGDLASVSRAVDPKHELAAVMRCMQKGPNKALMFRSVRGSDMPVATNVFGFRRAVAAVAPGHRGHERDHGGREPPA